MRLFLFLGLIFPGIALAQDEADPFQDLLGDEEDDLEIGPTKPAPTSEPTPNQLPDEGELDFEDDLENPDEDLLGEEPDASNTLGGDSALIYRATLDKVEGMDVDDEMQTWDAYLAQYPLTTFRAQIESRMGTLEASLYDSATIRRGNGTGDADDAQLGFSQALLLESIDPRRRVHFLVEYGLPDWASLGIGYEHAFSRRFSINSGIRRRFSGFSIESGVRVALVKSTRTQTLVTFLGDIHLNASPSYIGFRPQLAFGKRFGKLDLQGQAGVDIAPRKRLDIRGIGGLHGTFRASEVIGVFAETSILIKNQGGASGPFRFNQIAFGLRFYPARKAKKPDNVEINLGAAVPYSSAYWQYHYGAIVGQGNIYLD